MIGVIIVFISMLTLVSSRDMYGIDFAWVCGGDGYGLAFVNGA
jgi:hypothetical protein